MDNKPAGSRLGRGLDALMGEAEEFTAVESAHAGQPIESGKPVEIPIEDIAPNPYQPRRTFDEEQLMELASSIEQEGILQPLVLTNASAVESKQIDKPYVLIAGERRLRASHLAGKTHVPCIFREGNERKLVEWAMIENIQRADLNPIDKAKAYRNYMQQFKLTQQEVAQSMGQARATVANFMRLLDLADDVQTLVASGQVSFGHARTLAALTGDLNMQAKLAHRVVSEGLSVRKLEEIVAGQKNKTNADGTKKKTSKPAYVIDMEQQLTETIGTKVSIQPGRAKNTGKLVIDYYSLDDFDKIAGKLGLYAAQ